MNSPSAMNAALPRPPWKVELGELQESGSFRKLAVDRRLPRSSLRPPEVAELVVRVERLQHALHDAGAALKLLTAKGTLPPEVGLAPHHGSPLKATLGPLAKPVAH